MLIIQNFQQDLAFSKEKLFLIYLIGRLRTASLLIRKKLKPVFQMRQIAVSFKRNGGNWIVFSTISSATVYRRTDADGKIGTSDCCCRRGEYLYKA